MIIVKENELEVNGTPSEIIRECASVVVSLMFQTRDECEAPIGKCHNFYLYHLIQEVEDIYSRLNILDSFETTN